MDAEMSRSSCTLTRTPALSRSHRSTSSVSTASTSSLPSPTTLLTPQSFARDPAATRLESWSGSKWPIGDVYEEKESDFAGSDLARVLNLTPRLTSTSSLHPDLSDLPDDLFDTSVRPDDSPLLGPADDWVLPPIPSLSAWSSPRSSYGLDIQSRRSLERGGLKICTSPSPSVPRRMEMETLRDQEETMDASIPHNNQRFSSSDGSSINSRQSDWSTRSIPPSIPSRTSSRKHPGVAPRLSSLASSSASRSAPSCTSSQAPSRRQSKVSVISIESVLDPYPVLPSTSTLPSIPATPIYQQQSRKRLRSRSFIFGDTSSTPRFPIDFSAIPFVGLTGSERHHHLHRIPSAPQLRTPKKSSAMPSTSSPRHSMIPRTPSSHTRTSTIDFSASPGSLSSPNTRRVALFGLDLFTSPKPSPSAIEHIAEPSDRSNQETVIPLYDSALSPRTSVRLRPVSMSRRSLTPAEDVYSECRKADKMKRLIDQAGVDEAEEAMLEAEAWAWAKPPPREGRTVKFAVIIREGGVAVDEKHGRHLSGASTTSGLSGSGSDMGLSESHSIETINEEPILTPSSSSTLLTVPLPFIADPTTPTNTNSFLPDDPTPKAPTRSDTSTLRRSNSHLSASGSKSKSFFTQAAALAFASEPPNRKIKEMQQAEKAETGKGGWRGSLGRSGGKTPKEEKIKVKKEKTAWSFMASELGTGGLGGL